MMKHSVRHQEQVYDDQTTGEIVKTARQILRIKIAGKRVFGHDSNIKENSSSEKENSEKEFKILELEFKKYASFCEAG